MESKFYLLRSLVLHYQVYYNRLGISELRGTDHSPCNIPSLTELELEIPLVGNSA